MTQDPPLVYSKYNTATDMSTLTQGLTFNDHVAPQGFTTDFTTTYWFIRWFIPRFGRANIAAVIHDWQYVNPLFTSKRKADENFRLNLIALGYSKFMARLYWLGVTVGGGSSFDDGSKQLMNPKVIKREATRKTRAEGKTLNRKDAVAVESIVGIVPGVTRPMET